MRLVSILRAAVAAFCLGTGFNTVATAQTLPIEGVASVEILQGYRTDSGTHMSAARIRLKEGWKTYWRAPGSNGIPPQFSWRGSKNIVGVAYHWPAPKVFIEDGLRTIGYKNELVLPIEFQPTDGSADILVAGTIDFGVCDDVCIPARASFRTVLSRTGKSGVAEISKALKAGPATAKQGGVLQATCAIAPVKDGFSVNARVKTRGALDASTFAIVEFASSDVWVDSGPSKVSGNSLTTSAVVYPFGKDPFVFDRSKVLVTLLGRGKAVEIRGCSA